MVANFQLAHGNARPGTQEWADAGEQLANAWSDLADCRSDAKEVEKAREKAVTLRNAVLAGYPMLKSADEVLLAQSRDLVLLGRETEAATAVRNLVRKYPQSRRVPDALVQMGDLSFNANDMMGAIRAFDAVLGKYPKSALIPYATYKRSWCSFNLGDFADAMKRLVRVLSIAKKASLVRTAQNDLVRAYGHIGKPSAAFKMFRRWAPKRAFELTRRLAVAYDDMGKTPEAVVVYGVLAREARAAKRHADVVTYRRAAISSRRKAQGVSSRVVKAVETLLASLDADLKGASAAVKAEVRQETRAYVVAMIARVTADHVRVREPHLLQRATILRHLVDRYLPGTTAP